MRMVSYPAALSQVAMVELSSPWSKKFQKPPEGSTLTHTWWLWVYWPRRMVALEGQQSERVTHGLVNSTPWSARRLWVLGMYLRLRSRCFMSSARMNRMLGFAAVWARPLCAWLALMHKPTNKLNSANNPYSNTYVERHAEHCP